MPDISAEMIAAAISFISAAASFFFSLRSQAAQSAALEMDIRNMIQATRNRFRDLASENSDLLHADEATLPEVEKKKKELAIDMIQESFEAYVNAYDEACAKYIDKKIDRVRFKKLYQTEVRQLVEDKQHQGLFGRSTRFRSLVKVYDEWEHKDKA